MTSKDSKKLVHQFRATEQSIQFQKTRKDFKGDVTLVVFPLLRVSKKGPEQTADQIGNYLKENVDEVAGFNVVKGFLNLEITQEYWYNQFVTAYNTADYGTVKADKDSPTHLVEYSSPNTNKPIHLGHLRNNFLGYSCKYSQP